MAYDITVLTLISRGNAPHARDEITFYGVGDSVKDAIAGSCKETLFKLIKLPEDKSPFAWNLKYRTIVRESGCELIYSDTKMITFPGMDGAAMYEFKQWAVEQLRETVEAVEKELEIGPVATKKRNKISALWKLLTTRTG